MTVGRIASPVDDEVSSVLDLTQGARDLATQLGGYFGWTVSQRGVAIDHASDPFGQGHRMALRLARDIAEPVHQRHVRFVEVAADYLYEANMPLVYGLSNITCEAQRGAVALTERIGGVIDSHTSL